MKKTLTIIGAVAILGSGGVAFGAVQNPYIDRGTHFELPIVSDFPQGERVEIAKDKPEMTMYGWNDEYAIKITPQFPNVGVTELGNRPLFSKRMEFKRGDITAFIEPVEGTTNEFDIDFMLDSKPNTNVFTYIIEGAEDFDFWYQPALTQAEIDDGSFRPENVIGSYAVYHKTKANHRVGSTNYATGKVMHIYRPEIIDGDGNKSWASLFYAEGELTVTIPLEIYNDPTTNWSGFIVDPNFGYESIGVNGQNNANFIWGTNFAGPGEVACVTSISTYLSTGNSGTNIKYGMYLESDDSFLGESVEDTNLSATINDWHLLNVTPNVELANASTNLVSWTDASFGRVYDNATDEGRRDSETYSATWPDPMTVTEDIRKFSIFATFTAGACGAGASDTPSSTLVSDGAIIIRDGGIIIR